MNYQDEIKKQQQEISDYMKNTDQLNEQLSIALQLQSEYDKVCDEKDMITHKAERLEEQLNRITPEHAKQKDTLHKLLEENDHLAN